MSEWMAAIIILAFGCFAVLGWFTAMDMVCDALRAWLQLRAERPIPDRRFPRFGVWIAYPLTTAARYLSRLGWRLRAHVLVIGPIFVAIGWRARAARDGGR